MRCKLPLIVTTALLAFAGAGMAQLKTLGVSDVKVNPSVMAAANAASTGSGLTRVKEAIDGQMIAYINGTRKFQVVARSDLDAILQESSFRGTALNVSDVEYLLVATIDDFQEVVETLRAGSLGMTAERKRVRLGMVARIYEASSGKVLDATNFQLDLFDASQVASGSSRTGDFSEGLLRQIADDMGRKIAFRVVDVIFPARIVAKTGKQITINRGDGAGIAVGETWEVFAVGEELFDPDTGVSLGREEYPVGAARILRVNPQTSLAEIVGEDLGIERGAVLRRRP